MQKEIGIGLTIALLFVTGVTMTGSAMAQSNNSTVDKNNYTVKNETVIMAIDSHVDLVDYEFKDGIVYVVVENSYPVKQLRISDMYSEGEGASRMADKTVMLQRGRNVITFDVTEVSGEQGVSIATNDGIVGIREKTGIELFTKSYSGWSVMAGSILGGGVSATGLLVLAYKREMEISSKVKRIL